MTICLNGKNYETKAACLEELKEEYQVPENQTVIWIVEGFQTQENLPISEGMTVHCIPKGVFPPEEELLSMMCARHTPHVHEKVRQAGVAIAGLGGLGSNIAVMLARTGVGRLHLIDFDIVEPSNLNRQQYFIRHLGMYKTEAMRDLLSQINPYIEVRVDTVKIDESNCAGLFAEDEIICEAFDKPDAKALLTDVILTEYPEKYLICGSGMAGYGTSNAICTRAITDHFYLCGDGVSAAAPGNGLMAPRVTICAAHEANMALRCILGLGADGEA